MMRRTLTLFGVLGFCCGLLCGQGTASYLTAPTYVTPTISSPFLQAIGGDFTGDGLGDVVTGAGVLHLGTAQGTLGAEVPIPFPSTAGRVIAGDLDGDGDLDLVLADAAGPGHVMLNAGAGAFVYVGVLPLTSPPLSLVVGDLDLDGAAEVIACSAWQAPQGSVIQIVALSGGALSLVGQIATGQALSAPAMGDVTGDGLPDLVFQALTNPGTISPNALYVLSGLGIKAGLGTGFMIPTGSQLPSDTTFVGDFNEDGIQDLGSPMLLSGGWVIRISLSPSFGSTWVTASSAWVPSGNQAAVLVGDVNDDAHLDLFGLRITASGSTWQGDVGILLGDGTGQFSAPMVLPLPPVSVHPVIAPSDVDGDGDLDVAVLDSSCAEKGVALNAARFGGGCPASSGVTPRLRMGRERPGNAGFLLGVESAPAGVPALLGVSLAATPPTPAGCSVVIDLSPGALLWPLPGAALPQTDATGSASQGFPLPNTPALLGVTVHAQWAIADALAANGVAALSPGRTIIFW